MSHKWGRPAGAQPAALPAGNAPGGQRSWRAAHRASGGAAPAAAAWSSVSRERPYGSPPPPAEVPRDRIPLAIPPAVLPTVALEVPSTDAPAFDHAPAGGPRARSADVNADATLSSRLRTQRCLARLHQPPVAQSPGKLRGTERWFKPPASCRAPAATAAPAGGRRRPRRLRRGVVQGRAPARWRLDLKARLPCVPRFPAGGSTRRHRSSTLRFQRPPPRTVPAVLPRAAHRRRSPPAFGLPRRFAGSRCSAGSALAAR